MHANLTRFRPISRLVRRIGVTPRRRRTLAILVTVCAAVLLAGVVVAQASENYDLACRGVLNSGGGYRITPSNSFAIIDAIGQPIAGISQNSTYGVYGGYVHPFEPAQSPPKPPPPDLGNELNLPFLAKAGRIIRGGC